MNVIGINFQQLLVSEEQEDDERHHHAEPEQVVAPRWPCTCLLEPDESRVDSLQTDFEPLSKVFSDSVPQLHYSPPAQVTCDNAIYQQLRQLTEYTANIRYGPGSDSLNAPLPKFVLASSNESKRQWEFV
jgi:hypothetical protein